VEVYSLPYSAINMWSSENAGSILDFTGELELWTRAGKIKISVGKQVDVRRLDMLIAMCVLGGKLAGDTRHGDQRTPQLMLGRRACGRRYAGVRDMSTNCATCA